MRYTKFTIKNYKGIDNLTLDLTTVADTNITVLVGLNESGKTTILEALDFFFNSHKSLDGGSDIKNEAYKLIPRKHGANFNKVTSVEAEIKLDDEDELAINRKFEEIKSDKSLYPIRKFKIKTQVEFEDSKYIENSYRSLNWCIDLKIKPRSKESASLSHDSNDDLQPVADLIKHKLIPKVVYYPNFLSSFPDKIYTDAGDQPDSIDRDQQEVYRVILQDILDSLNDERGDNKLELNKHVSERIRSSTDEDKTALEALLGDISKSMTEKIAKNWSKIFVRGTSTIEIVVGDGKTNDGKPYLGLKIKQSGETYKIGERSLGFKWFFLFLLFTEYRQKRSSESGKTLFLIDEPASNLHSSMQKRLTEMIADIAKESHILYTTHNHHLINPRWLGSTFIVKNEAISYKEPELGLPGRPTEISIQEYKHFVSRNPGQSEYFQPILDSLDYQPSKLEMIEPLVVVEGKNDYYTLRYMFENILKINSYFNIYPGGGAGKNSQVLRLYIAWSKKIIVLNDSDVAGMNAQKQYEAEFKPILKDCLFTLKDIDSGWQNCSMEDLFSVKGSEDQRLRVIQKEFSRTKKYSKRKFNESIQNMHHKNTHFDFDENTILNFKKIHKFLSDKTKNSNAQQDSIA